MRTRNLLAAALLGLTLSGSALAEEPAHGVPADPHAAPADHGTGAGDHAAAAGDHAAAAGDHGEGAHDAHHIDFLADDDHDGTANWLDSDSDGYVVMKLVQHAFNLTILIGLLVYFGRRPIGDALKTRAAELRKELTEAARARDEAQAKFAELNARLEKFEDEVAKMKADAQADARAEEARLIARAQAEAARIAESADRTIADELRRARVALRDDAVALAVELAEGTLRGQVQGDDQRRLARQFLDTLSAE